MCRSIDPRHGSLTVVRVMGGGGGYVAMTQTATSASYSGSIEVIQVGEVDRLIDAS